MIEAISKMRQAVALTIIMKSKEGQQHGFFSEEAHRKEFSKYADAAALIYAEYSVAKIEKSPAALLAFADQTLLWATNMEMRLWEIKGINEQFKYFNHEHVTDVYQSMVDMIEDLLQVLFPDAVNQVLTILTDSQNKAP